MFTDAVTIAFGVFDAVCACTAVEAVATCALGPFLGLPEGH